MLTDPGVGGTFLTWSLHFLAGHTQYYSTKCSKWVDLPSDPLTVINAHGFTPNQPTNIDQFNLIYSSLLEEPESNFHTIYFHNFEHISTPGGDTQKAIFNLDTKKNIFLSLSNQHLLYKCSYKSRSRTLLFTKPGVRSSNDDERYQDFIDYFFKDSQEIWKALNLTAVWDRREFLALNLRPYDTVSIATALDPNKSYYTLDTAELWNTFDSTVGNLFEYLELNIDEYKKSQWEGIYYKWKKLHYPRMLFVWYFDRIIDYILSGREMDLTRFNLDIIQEATIQHVLLYKHNLNLKTWQLTKFKNTKQLHQLLESNIHTLNTLI